MPVESCDELTVFVHDDEAAIRERVPRHYRLAPDPLSGRTLLSVRASRCRVTVNGRAARTIVAQLSAVIDSPDGAGCVSHVPVLGALKGDLPPVCNLYSLFWATDNRDLVAWLREGTRRYPVRHVRRRRFTYEVGEFDLRTLAVPFRFRAKRPTPSPFEIEALTRERPGEFQISPFYYTDVPRGVVKVSVLNDRAGFAEASGTVRARPGSQMTELMGAKERPFAAGYSLFVPNRLRAGAEYRKEILKRSPRGE